MRKLSITFILIFLFPLLVFGSDVSVKYTVLKGQKAKNISAQCSRENPPAFNEIWIPDEKTISFLESKLEKIEQLSPELCCLNNIYISNVRSYFRQYVGIVSKGHRLIYINAFGGSEPPKNWLEEPVIACDGGTNFWGVIFNPETGEFSQLAINGVA